MNASNWLKEPKPEPDRVISQNKTVMNIVNFQMGMNPYDDSDYAKGYYQGLEDAIKAVTHYENSAWIPVSERLPDEYDEYLCQDVNGDRFVGWLENAEWCKKHVAKWNIVAWMPLPEPYKGNSSL